MTAILQGATCLQSMDDAGVVTWLAGVVALAGGMAVLIGLFTPVAAAAAAVAIVLIVMTRASIGATGHLPDSGGALCAAAVAAALTLLGPGAMSLDARLFGRREIVFPADPHAAAGRVRRRHWRLRYHESGRPDPANSGRPKTLHTVMFAPH